MENELELVVPGVITILIKILQTKYFKRRFLKYNFGAIF